MSDYMPTTEEVRDWWTGGDDGLLSQGFDRWLASVKAEAWVECQRKQLDAQAIALPRGITIPIAENPYLETGK